MKPRRRAGQPLKSAGVKRSVGVAGHKTSVSLEGAFWNALKEIAAARNIRVSKLISTIELTRQPGGGLSSAIRLFHSRLLPTASPTAPNPKQPPGPPMTLGNMREQGVRGLAVYYLNHACRHHAVVSADDYPATRAKRRRQ
jgi:predicted DNA-binding ribbon-helix-helix protein